MNQKTMIKKLEDSWKKDLRWKGIKRRYSAVDVFKLRGTIRREYSIAKAGADRLWKLLRQDGYVHALSAVTGNQAIQQVQAGLKAIYVSGWQVAADMNNSLRMYPDQSLYPSDSVPYHIRRINNSLIRADQIHHLKGDRKTHWLAPIIADAEAGFGGSLHAFEIMKMMIEDGASGVHFEDQLASVKKCGHLGGKVLVPTSEFVTKLIAARLAADVCGISTLLVARTDAFSASLLTNDVDPYDHEFIYGSRTSEGFWQVKEGLAQAISRGLAYAPYADLLWFETSQPDLKQAKEFARVIHKKYPGKMLAYNCSPSFNWKANLDQKTIAKFQKELGKMGYKFQFVTLSGFHSLNHGMYELARAYKVKGMAAYSKLQNAEQVSENTGYEALKHQTFVGTGYYDAVTQIATAGKSSTLSMQGSTETAQFKRRKKKKS